MNVDESASNLAIGTLELKAAYFANGSVMANADGPCCLISLERVYRNTPYCAFHESASCYSFRKRLVLAINQQTKFDERIEKFRTKAPGKPFLKVFTRRNDLPPTRTVRGTIRKTDSKVGGYSFAQFSY